MEKNDRPNCSKCGNFRGKSKCPEWPVDIILVSRHIRVRGCSGCHDPRVITGCIAPSSRRKQRSATTSTAAAQEAFLDTEISFLCWRVAQVLILLTLSTQWVPRPSRFLRRAGTTNVCSGAELGHSMAERNLRPALVHAHRPRFVQKIETITAPPPLLR
jgi:hypothetical protein